MTQVDEAKVKITAADYKGKWFVLEDGESGDAPHIDIKWAMGEGLREHVEACRYYGIPPYIGGDKELEARIVAIQKELGKDIHTAP